MARREELPPKADQPGTLDYLGNPKQTAWNSGELGLGVTEDLQLKYHPIGRVSFTLLQWGEGDRCRALPCAPPAPPETEPQAQNINVGRPGNVELQKCCPYTPSLLCPYGNQNWAHHSTLPTSTQSCCPLCALHSSSFTLCPHSPPAPCCAL